MSKNASTDRQEPRRLRCRPCIAGPSLRFIITFKHDGPRTERCHSVLAQELEEEHRFEWEGKRTKYHIVLLICPAHSTTSSYVGNVSPLFYMTLQFDPPSISSTSSGVGSDTRRLLNWLSEGYCLFHIPRVFALYFCGTGNNFKKAFSTHSFYIKTIEMIYFAIFFCWPICLVI